MAVASIIACEWDCDEEATEGVKCKNDPEMKAVRGCEIALSRPLIFGGVEFKTCPKKHDSGEAADMVGLYIDCVGGVLCDGWGAVSPIRHLPFAGGIADQPKKLMDALKIVGGRVKWILDEKNRS